MPLLQHRSALTILFLLGILTASQGSNFNRATYQALGGNPETDKLNQAITVLKGAIDLSKTGRYRTVVRCGNGSATWIGNSKNKSYFITAAHLVNAAKNSMTTYAGTNIPPVAGSVFHTAFNDFGLLEYNAVLDPALFGGQSSVLMDQNLVQHHRGAETTLVGHGNLTVGSRKLGRTRCLSTAFITLENKLRTRSTPSPHADPKKSFAGSSSSGDSGGGVFLNLKGTQVLVGAISSGNSNFFNYANLSAHRPLIDSVVPKGTFTWYSDLPTPPRQAPKD